MSNGTETIVMPEYVPPSSFGEVLANQRDEAASRLIETNKKFSLWESLPQDVKDKLDQVVGYKPI